MTAPPDSDAALLARARDLDGRALALIHDQYYTALYRYALYRLGEPEAAADVAAEVFVRLLDALHRGRAPQTSLRGWLFGVAGHLVVDHYRRRPAAPLSDDLPDPGGAQAVAGEAEARLARAAVQAELRRLTDEQQQVLALRFGDGFSVEETATTLGKSVTAVKALQFRAVEALRRALRVQDD
jgi:RNA polymerase sigma-70 factor (ECF subfamily)